MYIPADWRELCEETLIQGTVEQIRALLATASTLYWEGFSYQHLVSEAVNSLSDQHSLTTNRVRVRVLDHLVPGAKLLAGAAEEAKYALARYADEIERIHFEAGNLASTIDGDLHLIRESNMVISEIANRLSFFSPRTWNEGPPVVMPEPGHSADVSFSDGVEIGRALLPSVLEDEWRWAIAARQWRDAAAEVETSRQRWSELLTERQGAEHRLRGVLAASGAGQLRMLVESADVALERGLAYAFAGEHHGDAAFVPNTEHHLLTLLLGRSDGFDIYENSADPYETATRWADLAAWQQETLIERTPWVIGNLPGLPFEVRGRANLIMLQQYVVNQESLSPQSHEAVQHLNQILQQGRGEPDTVAHSGFPLTLVSLNLHSRIPLVSLGYGPLDTATSLTWQVPGMDSDANMGISTWHTASQNLLSEQQRLMESAGLSDAATGLIVFLAYDTPEWSPTPQSLPYNPVSVLFSDRANAGAVLLATEIDGTSATWNVEEPGHRLNIVAHSYGTTVASLALLQIQQPIDSFIMLGSAGLDSSQIGSLSELRVVRDETGTPQIYTTMASADWIAPIGSNLSNRLQPNPESAWAHALSTGGIYEFSAEAIGELNATTGHSVVDDRPGRFGYLDATTQSLNTVASLTLGLTEILPDRLGLTEQRELSLAELWSLSHPVGPVRTP